MPEQTLPKDKTALSKLYQDTIDYHRDYLNRLHEAFNQHCEAIGAKAKDQLSKIDESDEEKRKEILVTEQKDLDEALTQLKTAINQNNADARKKLEEIQNKIEESAMDLEAELAKL
ncbi:hypothetical protein JW752_00620 [Candidatus Peregrinibacteria bacterium]|nr:hypothetical protein [Candidatus Peregrinibacteria bacterium]